MAESAPPDEAADIRRKALIRLGIAAGITAAALTGLWWLDRPDPAAKPNATSPAPITAAPTGIAAPPTVDETLAPSPTPEGPADEIPAGPSEPPTASAPPPPEVGRMPRATPAVADPHPPRPTAPVPAPAPPTRTGTSTPPQRPPPSVPAPVADGHFSVQLGVFQHPGNAQALVERLRQRGIRAYAETRVHVGPFLNQAEADKARLELKRLGYEGLVSRTVTSQ